MTAALTVALAGYGACLAVIAAILTLRQSERPRWYDTLVYLFEGGLLLRAMIGVGELAAGHHVDELVTHVAYLVSSVALLPLALNSLAEDRTHWSTAVLTVVCLAIVVVVIRIQVTAPGHG